MPEIIGCLCSEAEIVDSGCMQVPLKVTEPVVSTPQMAWVGRTHEAVPP